MKTGVSWKLWKFNNTTRKILWKLQRWHRIRFISRMETGWTMEAAQRIHRRPATAVPWVKVQVQILWCRIITWTTVITTKLIRRRRHIQTGIVWRPRKFTQKLKSIIISRTLSWAAKLLLMAVMSWGSTIKISHYIWTTLLCRRPMRSNNNNSTEIFAAAAATIPKQFTV